MSSIVSFGRHLQSIPGVREERNQQCTYVETRSPLLPCGAREERNQQCTYVETPPDCFSRGVREKRNQQCTYVETRSPMLPCGAREERNQQCTYMETPSPLFQSWSEGRKKSTMHIHRNPSPLFQSWSEGRKKSTMHIHGNPLPIVNLGQNLHNSPGVRKKEINNAHIWKHIPHCYFSTTSA